MRTHSFAKNNSDFIGIIEPAAASNGKRKGFRYAQALWKIKRK
jgi:hypothetical protein